MILRILLFWLFISQSIYSTQYLCEDTWYAFGDWIYSPEETFDPDKVCAGDTIVIKDLESRLLETLHSFEENILPYLKYPVILICPRTDYALPGKYSHLVAHEKIGAWFVQNIDRKETEKLYALPIGLVSPKYGCDHRIFDVYIEAPYPQRTSKKHFLYLNFAMTSEERKTCIAHFKTTFPSIRFVSRKPFFRYMRDLSQSIFVVSPPGNGVDCHRTWEALLLGCYPIVQHSSIDPLFEGLPVVLIDTWDEVTPDFLREQYKKLSAAKWPREKLYPPYWFNKIREVQQKIRARYTN